MEDIKFRNFTSDDWTKIAEIYKQGIETGHATFQKEVPSWDEWDKGHLKICRLAAAIDGQIAGWAALSSVSSRCVYAGVAEVSIYIDENFRGRKIGKCLLEKLVSESEQNGIWTLQAGIMQENTPSIKLHESAGFRQAGYREKIGKLNGLWRNTILMERRSKII